MVIRFKDSSTEVRCSRSRLLAYPKSFHAFFSTDVLTKAGLRTTKTQVIGPLSAFRFLPGDVDAEKFAAADKVGLEMQRAVNTEALRRSTVPWPTSYGPAYANAIERGAVLDAESLCVVIPAKPKTAKAAASKVKAGANVKAKSTPKKSTVKA